MIRLEHLTKVFGAPGSGVTAVNDVNFEVPAGEICVLLGPSGCGKTTTMKMINRLIEPTGGKVYIDGRDTDMIDPIQLRRSIGYVIQQIGLFPNKTVAENICVVPDLLGWDRKKSRARAAELLEMVAMEPASFMERYPKELSGGQQQRVGVIRALAADPPVMLMDEPFGALDPINREVIQDEFLRMQETLRKTIIFVSHDLDEAVKMADKIAIFRAGRLEQFSTPDRLLANPATPFIETFLGSDRTLKRLRLLRVAEAMLAEVDVVRREDPVEKAGELMRAKGYPAVLMLEPDGRPGGVVSGDVISGGQASARSGTCGDHAEPIRAAVPVEADLHSTVALMFTHDMPIMPCVDEDGQFQGAVTYRSIIKSLSIPETPA
ncbi:ABC transporter ATP-binding protein [Rhodospirillaceae bacterium SYSU D60014]|uniref:ABC transporter ATP-binding protein n=1 Tax=Virgifigura deserti TaxID=2268457 RepID=UPI000E671BCF